MKNNQAFTLIELLYPAPISRIRPYGEYRDDEARQGGNYEKANVEHFRKKFNRPAISRTKTLRGDERGGRKMYAKRTVELFRKKWKRCHQTKTSP